MVLSPITHLWSVFLNPKSDWQKLREQRQESPKLYIAYLFILAAVPPVSGFIGATQTGWRIGGGEITKLTVESAIPLCVMAYIGIIIGIVAVGKAIDWMRVTYTDLRKRDLLGISMSGYISLPLLILSVVGIFPEIWLGFIALIVGASYSVYLLYTGTPLVFQIPPERGTLFASAILTFALVIVVILMITTVIIWGIGFNPVFTN